MRVETPPGCLGVDAPGRTHTFTPREQGGAVEVPDAFGRQLVAAGLHQLPTRTIGFSSAPGWICTCGRDNFMWVETCSACGKER